MQFATKSLAFIVFITATIAGCAAGDGSVETPTHAHPDAGGQTTARSGTSHGSCDTTGDAGAATDPGQTDPGTVDPSVDASNPDPTTADDDAGAPDPTVMMDPPAPSGACTNDADTAVRGAHDMNAAAASCASGCLGAGPCTSTCLVGNPGLSSACATCYGAASQCTIDHCFWECIGGNTPGCGMCRVTQGCDAAFNACSGLM